MKDIRKGECPLCDHSEIVEGNPRERGHNDNGTQLRSPLDHVPKRRRAHPS